MTVSVKRDGAGFTIPRVLAALYLVYGACAILFLATRMPPFQNPDELAHFQRAAQIADGTLLARRFTRPGPNGEAEVTAGGLGDPAVWLVYADFQPMLFHPEVKIRPESFLRPIPWSGQRHPQSFPNTAIYPPLFYAPAALGIAVGQAAGLTVIQTLVAARMATGFVALGIGAAAIAAAGWVAPLLFGAMTLPMALMLMASTSQDALMVAFAALAGALLHRTMQGQGDHRTRLLTASAIGLIAMARPPYAALGCLVLVMPGGTLIWRLAAMGSAFAAAAAWLALAASAMTNIGAPDGADPAAQLAFLMAHPWVVFSIAVNTIAVHGIDYVQGFIGQIGWYDTSLPSLYVKSAAGLLIVATGVHTIAGKGDGRGTLTRAGKVAGLTLAGAGVFGALWLGWSRPGTLIVEGVQGRYFLPIALVGVSALPGFATCRWAWTRRFVVAGLMVFPVITLATVGSAVMARYYTGTGH